MSHNKNEKRKYYKKLRKEKEENEKKELKLQRKHRVGDQSDTLPVVKKSKKAWSIVFCVLFLLFVFLCSAIVHAAFWVTSTYDETTFEQILFNMIMPLQGVDKSLLKSGFKNIGTPAFIALLIGAAVYIPLTVIRAKGIRLAFKRKTVDFDNGTQPVKIKRYFIIKDEWYYVLARFFCWCLVCVMLGRGLVYADKNFALFSYIEGQFKSSSFIEDNYADPKTTDLEFPENKRNLVYIFLESVESTFTSKENGGAFDRDVIPELASMMLDKDNTSFSNTSLLGGAVSTAQATWTMGGMFAQSSGLPLKLPLDYNNMMAYSDTFLSDTYCLGDVLEENGYNQAIIMGSDGRFGGRTNYYTIHGNQTVYDWYTADDDGIRDSNYYKNYWGLCDKDLYAYAKKVLGDMSEKDKPFALTLLTVDTHFSSGYPCELCMQFKTDKNGNYVFKDSSKKTKELDNLVIEKFNYIEDQSSLAHPGTLQYVTDHYSNVYSCASKQIYDFVQWLSEQDFFEDTAIVIAGDHTTMDANYARNIPNSYVRTPMNLFINSSVSTENYKNRQFATLDMFPTTLAAMGVKINGDRLGLGVNLFSNEKTLIEKVGLDKFESELGKKSNFYNSMLFAR